MYAFAFPRHTPCGKLATVCRGRLHLHPPRTLLVVDAVARACLEHASYVADVVIGEVFANQMICIEAAVLVADAFS